MARASAGRSARRLPVRVWSSDLADRADVAVIGILLAQFTITGFDASAHMAEETRNAAKQAVR